MEFFAQAILNGFGLALVYILVALGLTIIFSILGIINFAQGEFYMLGGFVTYYFFAVFGMSYFLTLVLAIVLVGLAGVITERLIFARLRGRTLNGFIISLGLLWVMQSGALLSFGGLDKGLPPAFPGVVHVFGITISFERLIVALSAMLLIIALYFFLESSRPGRAMRAVAQDADAAALQGVNIEITSMYGFGIGSALAGGAGALLAPIFSVSPFMGSLPVIKAFIIVILGGMGSLPGAVVGGLVLGFVEAVGSLFLSSASVSILEFLLVIAILLVRPQGLLGAK